MNFLAPSPVQSVVGTFQNTWRNIVVGFVLGSIIISGVAYIIYTRLFVSVYISDTSSSTVALVEPLVEVRGVKEYTSFMIGGDISTEPPVHIPQNRQMFIPFDTRTISASSVMVKDVGSGKVLFGKNEYAHHSLASVTKLMSALVLEEYITDWGEIAVTPRDSIFDSHVFAGEEGTLQEWYDIGLVVSSNRAILALVDGSGRSREEFVVRMNEKAKELGMLDTVFTDPTGIDPGNVSSASDAAMLLTEALRNPHIAKTLSLRSVDHTNVAGEKSKTLWSTNWLLTNWIYNDFYEPVIGKTGYIVESDYNFVGKFTRDEHRSILVIVLGSKGTESRFTDALELANWAFINYEWTP